MSRKPLPRGQQHRRFVPPLGWPPKFRVVTTTPADHHPLIVLNRYPRQVIGLSIRLPDDATQFHYDRNTGERTGHRRRLGIIWAEPARWWKR